VPKGKVVAVVGAGPAGLYLSRKLAEAGVEVAIVNRDVKYGGLAEYGIYHDKYKMKEGLRKQFRAILSRPNVHYFGNVRVGADRDLALEELRALGFDAVVVAAGAQGTKSLRLEGEDLAGVFHAKDIVYHYNRLPPYAERPFDPGPRVAVIGVGNVFIDVAHWLVWDRKVESVIAVARRGPRERKWTPIELEAIAANVDRDALARELERVRPAVETIGQDLDHIRQDLLAELDKWAQPTPSKTRVLFRFLSSPTRVIAGPEGRCAGLEVEETELAGDPEEPKAKGTGRKVVLDVTGVVFAVGDVADPALGLPYRGGKYVTQPHHPGTHHGDAAGYHVFDEKKDAPVQGVFVAGWSRVASEGVVGKAKVDGEKCANVVLGYLMSLSQRPDDHASAALAALRQRLEGPPVPYVTWADLQLLEAWEREQAAARGLADHAEAKLGSTAEMLRAIAERKGGAATSAAAMRPSP